LQFQPHAPAAAPAAAAPAAAAPPASTAEGDVTPTPTTPTQPARIVRRDRTTRQFMDIQREAREKGRLEI
jgi:hypothetical protein